MATNQERNGQGISQQSCGDQKLALNAKEAAKCLSSSERLLWTLTNQGKVPHMRLGTRVLYPVELLHDWFIKRASIAVRA